MLITKITYEDLFKQGLTLVSKKRYENFHNLALKISKENIEGTIVECGTYKCGLLASVTAALRELNDDRCVWGFDTFEGIPKSNPIHDGKNSAGRGKNGDLLATIDVARDSFKQFKIDEKNIFLIKGLFQDTLKLHVESIGKIAILRLDGDWYESTKVCLDTLYDSVIDGGYIIIDDFGHWEGCRKAVNEFLKNRNIVVKFNKTDYTEVWWQK